MRTTWRVGVMRTAWRRPACFCTKRASWTQIWVHTYTGFCAVLMRDPYCNPQAQSLPCGCNREKSVQLGREARLTVREIDSRERE